jgi:hypothetical protein
VSWRDRLRRRKFKRKAGMSSTDSSQDQRDGLGAARPDRRGPLESGNATLHHLGFVVASISAVAAEFAESISVRWDGRIIHDPIQRVRVAFFTPGDPRNPVFELVEPASGPSPVTSFLKNRAGLHHVCTKSTTWSQHCARHGGSAWHWQLLQRQRSLLAGEG